MARLLRRTRVASSMVSTSGSGVVMVLMEIIMMVMIDWSPITMMIWKIIFYDKLGQCVKGCCNAHSNIDCCVSCFELHCCCSSGIDRVKKQKQSAQPFSSKRAPSRAKKASELPPGRRSSFQSKMTLHCWKKRP